MKTAAQHNADEFNLGRVLFDQANAMNAQFAAGMKAGREQAESQHATIMRALANTYEKALADKKVVLPADLGLLLHAILMDVRAVAK